MFYVLFLAQEKLCREDIATKAMACFSKDDTIHIVDEVSATPFRRDCQTTLRCKLREDAVVNGQRKSS
jgi:hypothetical protein